jgi:hypothetical protein
MAKKQAKNVLKGAAYTGLGATIAGVGVPLLAAGATVAAGAATVAAPLIAARRLALGAKNKSEKKIMEKALIYMVKWKIITQDFMKMILDRLKILEPKLSESIPFRSVNKALVDKRAALIAKPLAPQVPLPTEVTPQVPPASTASTEVTPQVPPASTAPVLSKSV